MKHKINSLHQLEKEQEKLRMQMTVTKDAFSKSLGTNQKELKTYLLKNVAIPAGVIGLSTMAMKQLGGSSTSKQHKTKSSSTGLLLKSFFPLFMNILQAYLLKRQKSTLEQQAAQVNEEGVPVSTLKRVS